MRPVASLGRHEMLAYNRDTAISQWGLSVRGVLVEQLLKIR